MRFFFKIIHEGKHTIGNASEVMVFQLLSFSRCMSEECSACKHQVGALVKQITVNQEVFLLNAQRNCTIGHFGIEQLTNFGSRFSHKRNRLQQRCFIIQGFACVAYENGWNAQGFASGFFHDECRRIGIPGGITAGLKGVADATVGEAACIRLLLHQSLAAEAFHAGVLSVWFEERIMLFSGSSAQRLKPVRVMFRTFTQCPRLHAFCNLIGHCAIYRSVEFCGLFNGL